ncbi:hypothetical protein P7M43_30560, partial [Vibrio parahaemolyticus]|nr:hypothetical protein [Vibrio parahaemolyticus]
IFWKKKAVLMVFKNTLKSILAQDFFVKLDYFVNLFYAFWGCQLLCAELVSIPDLSCAPENCSKGT